MSKKTWPISLWFRIIVSLYLKQVLESVEILTLIIGMTLLDMRNTTIYFPTILCGSKFSVRLKRDSMLLFYFDIRTVQNVL